MRTALQLAAVQQVTQDIKQYNASVESAPGAAELLVV